LSDRDRTQRGCTATKESGAFTTEDTAGTETKEKIVFHEFLFWLLSVFSVRSVVSFPKIFACRE
jgi:hypothetical protein